MTQRLSVFLVLVLALTACSNDDPDTIQIIDDGGSVAGIAVSGTGEVLGAPDTLTVTLGVQVIRDSVDEANSVAAQRMDDLIEAVTSEGVDRDDLQTADFSIYPEYDYGERSRRLVGFRVSNTLIVKIRDVDNAGSIIDAAVDAGGDETIVSGIGFSVEDDAARLEEARSRAWADAEAKARQIAGLAGVELGTAIRVTEGVQSVPFRSSFEQAVGDEGGFDVAIEPGQVSSVVQLTVVFSHS